MKLREPRLKIISSSKEFSLKKEEWDNFIERNKLPVFFRSGFLGFRIGLAEKKKFKPYLVLIYSHHEIICGIPLMVRPHILFPQFEFLYEEYHSPDILINDHYREALKILLDILFKKILKKWSICITFNKYSQSLSIIKKLIKTDNYGFILEKGESYKILKKEKTWDDYVKNRSGSYRRQIKRIKKKYIPQYKIIRENNFDKISKIMLYVDQKSWKKEWWSKRGQTIGEDHTFIVNSIRDLPKNCYSLYYLTYENKIISYTLIFIENNLAYISKTSYDEEYKEYYPGILLINEVLKSLHSNDKVQLFNFQTYMGFMSIWTKKIVNRYRVTIFPHHLKKITYGYNFVATKMRSLLIESQLLEFYREEFIPMLLRKKSYYQ